jgi:uncharacterized membrane protein HdeD (DUF308 family)
MTSGAVSKLGSGGSIIWAIALILLGAVAIAVPFVAASGVVVLLAWLLLFSGGVQVIHAFQAKGAGGVFWNLVVAVLYLAVGAYLVMHPAIAVAALTLALAIFFVVEGASNLVAYVRARGAAGSIWILIDGVVTLAVGLMVWRQWPSSSLWVIGTLVGVSMIMTGVSRLMLNLAARRLRHAVS